MTTSDPDGSLSGPADGGAAAPSGLGGARSEPAGGDAAADPAAVGEAPGAGAAAEAGAGSVGAGSVGAGSVGADPAGAGPAGAGGKPSGLRNPAAAVRGLGAGTLIIEAIVLLLAIQPIRLMGGQLSGAAVAVVVALAGCAIVVSGLMKRPWAWHAGTALQACLLLSGFLHWSLGALGIIFAATWGYATYVRRSILG